MKTATRRTRKTRDSAEDGAALRDALFREILQARKRVYAVAPPTPLERLEAELPCEIYLKREDLSPIHAYKWRGAFNRMSVLTDAQRGRGVVAASAGNHAQGVAIAARRLGVFAQIFMPRSTPQMKRRAVARIGGDGIEVVLTGDTYDAASREALKTARSERKCFIHPYDDLVTMGGQGTLADEIVMSGKGPFDTVYLQIGGGGMAAAVACWLRAYYPGIRIVGVEGADQASMAAAFRAGHPVALDYVDVFCDGTAVSKAGKYTYPLCRELLDELITVTNDEVCAAIQLLWETRRCIPEPAGAMGLAGLLKQRESLAGKTALAVVCGANMDFGQLAWIARHAGIGAARRRYLRFRIDECSGSLLELLENRLDGYNIVEFQYGKTDEATAWPVIGIEAGARDLERLHKRLEKSGLYWEDVTHQEDVDYRIIHYRSRLFRHPFFINLEFPERAGALHDFLVRIRGRANICYLNYSYTGERVGRALVGFEFGTPAERERFRKRLPSIGLSFREISREAVERIL